MTAALLGALGVVLGAFGAHGLKELVPPETVNAFQTGVQYQMYHVFALLFIGVLWQKFSSRLLKAAGNCFLLGILLFSGSLYLITILKASDITVGKLGIITPVGGLFFIAGWLLLFLALLKKSPEQGQA